MTDPTQRGARRLYGRKRGRRLRPYRARLVAELLPRLRVPPAALAAPGALDPRALFDPRPRAVWLELGFGAGEHLAAQAAAHPDIGFLGAEPFEAGVAALLRLIDEQKLANIRIHTDDGRPLVAALAPASVERVFILFPDPWPKKRHHKRRLVSPAMMGELARILADDGRLRLVTDDLEYALAMNGLVAEHQGFGGAVIVTGGARPPDAPVTRYEQKARAAGRKPAFLETRRRPRPLAGAAPLV